MQNENKIILAQLKEIRRKQINHIQLSGNDYKLIRDVQNQIQGISKQRFLKNISESTGENESDIDTLIEQIIKHHN